jgi:hypothetical protein
LTRKEKKALRQKQSVQQLMGLGQFTENGVMTAHGELVFYLIKPDNLSVLSDADIRGRVEALTHLLCRTPEVQLLALDSRESFQRNKDSYQQRLEQEDNPALRDLLRQDCDHLDKIQATTATAREFAIVYRLDQTGTTTDLNLLEKGIRDQGFHVRRAREQDLKRLLAVYYLHDTTSDSIDSVDGERWVIGNG